MAVSSSNQNSTIVHPYKCTLGVKSNDCGFNKNMYGFGAHKTRILEVSII